MITIDKVTDLTNHLDGITAVIFDLDDTLYLEKDYVKSGYGKIAKAFPQIKNMQDKLWQVFLAGGKAIDQVLSQEGLLTDENKNKCLEIYRNQVPDIKLDGSVDEMLKALKSDGYKLGIITDGRVEGQRAKIKALDLERYVDQIIITDELGGIEMRKPNEKAFRLICERLGVDYKNAVYVGDNPKKDFIAPEKLGMRAIYYKNKEGLYSK